MILGVMAFFYGVWVLVPELFISVPELFSSVSELFDVVPEPVSELSTIVPVPSYSNIKELGTDETVLPLILLTLHRYF